MNTPDDAKLPARDREADVPATEGRAPDRYGADPSASAAGLDWERYLSAIRRYRWAIVLFTLLGSAAGVAVAHWMPARYLGQATLWIEWRDGGAAGGDEGPIRSADLLRSYDWVELLRSFAVLEHAARENRLFLEPGSSSDTAALRDFQVAVDYTPGRYRVTVDADASEYALRAEDSTVVERGPVGDSVGTSVGFRWAPSPDRLVASAPVEFEVHHLRDAARGLRDRIETFMLERGNFLRVEVAGSDPERTRAVLSSISRRFTELATELKRAKVDELTRMLENQLATAEDNLEEAEAALEEFRVANAGQPRRDVFAPSPSTGSDGDGGGGTLVRRYQELRFEIREIEQQREMIDRALSAEDEAGATVDMLTTIPAVQSSTALGSTIEDLTERRAELRALLQLYTREHEDVRALEREIEELRSRTIPRLARSLEGQMATRQRQLSEELDSLSGTLGAIPPRATRDAELERQVRIAEELFSTLKSRHEEARLAAASTLPDVQVLDEAEVGREPISDDGPQVVAFAFAASLGLALLGALLVDRLDTRVRYPEEVSRGLGLRILGTIPHLEAKKGVLDIQDAGAATEAFRSLRLNLSHAHGAAGPMMTTVTSPSPGDGKSFVALNLALTYARLGRRTLLIDGDIRKGRLYRLLKGRRKPGLTDHLSNGGAPDSVIQRTGYEKLDFIATGRGTQSGPELLQSSEMRDLVMEIRKRYEAVVVDSPPVGAGVDPLVLGTFSGSLLLVLRAGTTKRALTEAKLDLMTPLPIRVLGAVLNDVGRDETYYRYYGSYTPGYEVRNQAVQEVSAKLLRS